MLDSRNGAENVQMSFKHLVVPESKGVRNTHVHAHTHTLTHILTHGYVKGTRAN